MLSSLDAEAHTVVLHKDKKQLFFFFCCKTGENSIYFLSGFKCFQKSLKNVTP